MYLIGLGDGGRGDNAFTYVTVHHPEEGDADIIVVIG